jgi:hypothetical protein
MRLHTRSTQTSVQTLQKPPGGSMPTSWRRKEARHLLRRMQDREVDRYQATGTDDDTVPILLAGQYSPHPVLRVIRGGRSACIPLLWFIVRSPIFLGAVTATIALTPSVKNWAAAAGPPPAAGAAIIVHHHRRRQMPPGTPAPTARRTETPSHHHGYRARQHRMEQAEAPFPAPAPSPTNMATGTPTPTDAPTPDTTGSPTTVMASPTGSG